MLQSLQMASATVVGSTVAVAGAGLNKRMSEKLFVHGAPLLTTLRKSKLVSQNKGCFSVSAKADGIDDQAKVPAAAAFTSSLLIFLAKARSAHALTKQDIEDLLTSAEDISQQVFQTGSSVVETAQGVFDKVFTTVKPGIDVAAPYVQKTTETVSKYAAPLASDVAREAQKALLSAGVDTEPALEVAKSAAQQSSKFIEGAAPFGSNLLNQALAADPVFLAEVAGGLLLVYWFSPSLFSYLGTAARGYAGDLTAAQALDFLLNQDCTLIDIRSEREKEKSGVPSLPNNSKNKYVPIPVEEFPNKIRSQLRNSRKVEAEVAALKIASLRRLNKGSKIVIMDESGDVAKTVARCLVTQGFKNAWVVLDGFKGGRGWVQSRLGTDSYGMSFAEILSPSRIIPAKFGTTSSTRRLLPGGADD